MKRGRNFHCKIVAFSFLHFCDSESGGHVCQATAARVEYPASGGSEGVHETF